MDKEAMGAWGHPLPAGGAGRVLGICPADRQPRPYAYPHHRLGPLRFWPDGDRSADHVRPGDLLPDGLPGDFGLGGGKAV